MKSHSVRVCTVGLGLVIAGVSGTVRAGGNDAGVGGDLAAQREWAARRFHESGAASDRLEAAATLVRLGVDPGEAWRFISGVVTKTVADDLPNPVSDSDWAVGSKREMRPLAEAFVQRCAERELTVEACRQALSEGEAAIYALGSTGDPRGRDRLLRALRLRYDGFVLLAIQGLARLNDPSSIEPIVEACRRLPAGAVRSMAASYLVFFEDQRAQAAAEELVTVKAILNARRRIAREKGLKGVFGH